MALPGILNKAQAGQNHNWWMANGHTPHRHKWTIIQFVLHSCTHDCASCAKSDIRCRQQSSLTMPYRDNLRARGLARLSHVSITLFLLVVCKFYRIICFVHGLALVWIMNVLLLLIVSVCECPHIEIPRKLSVWLYKLTPSNSTAFVSMNNTHW